MSEKVYSTCKLRNTVKIIAANSAMAEWYKHSTEIKNIPSSSTKEPHVSKRTSVFSLLPNPS